MSISQRIKGFDLLSSNPPLQLNNETRHNTSYEAILSLLYIIFFSFCIWLYGKEAYYRESPKIETSEFEINIEEYNKISNLIYNEIYLKVSIFFEQNEKNLDFRNNNESSENKTKKDVFSITSNFNFMNISEILDKNIIYNKLEIEKNLHQEIKNDFFISTYSPKVNSINNTNSNELFSWLTFEITFLSENQKILDLIKNDILILVSCNNNLIDLRNLILFHQYKFLLILVISQQIISQVIPISLTMINYLNI